MLLAGIPEEWALKATLISTVVFTVCITALVGLFDIDKEESVTP
jgi:hypothetical protein